jgi:hypothetical protein
MRPFAAKVAFFAFAIAEVIVACGSRTGLLVDAVPNDAAVDTTLDAADAPHDGPLYEGGPLDVVTDCPQPPYCSPNDLGHIYKCGVAIYQCSSLEQCEEKGEEGAQCVNPCVDTLGQDTSNGCEFFAAEMDLTPDAAGVCYAVFVVNQWKTGEPAKIEVSRSGQVLDVSQFARIPTGKGTGITYGSYDASAGLPKDQIAILFLSRDPAAKTDPNQTDPRYLADCPPGVTPAIVGDASLHGTGKASAFRIKTNVPVVAYQMLPYGGGRARVTGATLLLPTNVWDTNYVVADAYQPPSLFAEPRAGPTTMVIAKSDNTTVTIKPTVDIAPGGGLKGTPANVPASYTINRGEYLQFTQPNELTGSAILASQPVAVIGGSTLMDVPIGVIRADSAQQQLMPVRALANEYVAVRYRNRSLTMEEAVPWRIVGAVDGTALTYEPSTPSGAPTTMNSRQMVEFTTSTPFVVKSQDASHPFYLASYMTGGFPYDGMGDPEFVNVIAPAQYLPRYTFFTDPTYPETNLVVVRVLDTQTHAFPEVTLDCAGLLGGWHPVGVSGNYQYTRIDLSTGDFQGQNGCDNGVHTISGSLPSMGDAGPPAVPRFGVTIWGFGNGVTWPPDDESNPKFTRWVSYGYPAGADVKQLNSVIVPAN